MATNSAQYSGNAQRPCAAIRRGGSRAGWPSGLGHLSATAGEYSGLVTLGILLTFHWNIPDMQTSRHADIQRFREVQTLSDEPRLESRATPAAHPLSLSVSTGRAHWRPSPRKKAGHGGDDRHRSGQRRSASSSSASASHSDGPSGTSARLSAFEIVPWRTPRRSAAACWVRSRRARQRASSAPAIRGDSREENRFGFSLCPSPAGL